MNPCSDHYTPAACAAANCPNSWTGPIERPQQATEQQHDDGTCHHAAGDPCPAQQPGDDLPRYRPHEPGPGQKGCCYRCFMDGWDAYKRGAALVNFSAGYITPAATHTCTPDRAAASLEALNAAGLAAICEIVYAVIDDGPDNDSRFPWDLYECDDHEQVRHSFVSEIRKRIWQRAAPATAGRVK